MTDTLITAALLGVVLLIAIIWFATEAYRDLARERREVEKEAQARHEWQALKEGGGGVFSCKPAMTRADAMAFVSRAGGPVMFVDDTNKIIFYRARD